MDALNSSCEFLVTPKRIDSIGYESLCKKCQNTPVILEDKKVFSKYLDDHIKIQIEQNYVPITNTRSIFRPIKGALFRLSSLIGLIFIKNKIFQWRHKREREQAKLELCTLEGAIKIMNQNIAHANTILEAIAILDSLAQIQAILNLQKDDYIRLLGVKDFNEKYTKIEANLRKTLINGKRKALTNFVTEKLHNDVCQKITLRSDCLIQEAIQIKEAIFPELSSPQKHRFKNNYEQYIASMKRLHEIKNEFETEVVRKTLPHKALNFYLSTINQLIEETENIFLEKAFAEDIKAAIKFDEKLPFRLDDIPVVIKNKHFRSLFEEIHQLRVEKYDDSKLKENPDHLLARKVSKAQFAASLGVRPKISEKGVNGAQFLRSTTGKFQGVFKGPNPDKSSYFHEYRHLFGLTQDAYLHSGKFISVVAEKAAYLIAKKMQSEFLTLSPTRIISFGGINGAFLTWQNNCFLGSQVAEKLNARKTFSEEELNRFQIFAAFDFLIQNLDRHNDNVMFKMNGNVIEKIIPIDNANILPKQKPAYSIQLMPGMHRFVWRNFTMAQHPFTEETKRVLRELPDNFVEEICEELLKDHEIASVLQFDTTRTDTFPSPESKALMEESFQFLKRVAAGEVTTPYNLSVM